MLLINSLKIENKRVLNFEFCSTVSKYIKCDTFFIFYQFLYRHWSSKRWVFDVSSIKNFLVFVSICFYFQISLKSKRGFFQKRHENFQSRNTDMATLDMRTGYGNKIDYVNIFLTSLWNNKNWYNVISNFAIN